MNQDETQLVSGPKRDCDVIIEWVYYYSRVPFKTGDNYKMWTRRKTTSEAIFFNEVPSDGPPDDLINISMNCNKNSSACVMRLCLTSLPALYAVIYDVSSDPGCTRLPSSMISLPRIIVNTCYSVDSEGGGFR